MSIEDADWNSQFDVVVVGSGVSGLAAALFAHELGLSAILLEKSSKLGGGTAFSYGLLWAPRTQLAEDEGYTDSREAVVQYMQHLAGGIADERRLAAYVDSVPEVIARLQRLGMPFQIIHGLPDHYFGIAPGASVEGRSIEACPIRGSELGAWAGRVRVPTNLPYALSAEEMLTWGGMERAAQWDAALMRERRENDVRGLGAGLVAHLVRLLLKAQIPIVTGCPAQRLIAEHDRIVAVETAGFGRIRAAKGVMLASGGYEDNPELIAAYEGLPSYRSPFEVALEHGDALLMASEHGGDVHLLTQNQILNLAFDADHPQIPGKTVAQAAGVIELCSPHTMVVNRRGERFADESYFPEFVPRVREYDHVSHSHANLPAYLIFDAQFWQKYGVAGRGPGGKLPKSVVRANAPRELARKLKIDPAGLARTLTRFNAFAANGVDEDFSRGTRKWSLAGSASSEGAINSKLGPIDRAPYFGVELHPTANLSAGLATDENGRVLRRGGDPIAGLYANGNAAAHTEFGAGYQAGYTLAAGMIFSYRAVHAMAEEVEEPFERTAAERRRRQPAGQRSG